MPPSTPNLRPNIAERDGAVRFEVRAKPRARKTRIVRVRGGALEVSLAAPPVDGAANDELVRFLAEVLGVPRRQVTILRGGTSQKKLVEVNGISGEQVVERLN